MGGYGYDNNDDQNMTPTDISTSYGKDPSDPNNQKGGGLPIGDWISKLFGGGSNTSNYLKWIQTIYSIYQDQRKPRYSTAPMTPQQKQLWDIYIQSLTNPAYAKNAEIANGLIADRLRNLNPHWDAPKTSTGQTGYPGSPSFTSTPFDWSKYPNLYPPQGNTPPTGTGGL